MWLVMPKLIKVLIHFWRPYSMHNMYQYFKKTDNEKKNANSTEI